MYQIHNIFTILIISLILISYLNGDKILKKYCTALPECAKPSGGSGKEFFFNTTSEKCEKIEGSDCTGGNVHPDKGYCTETCVSAWFMQKEKEEKTRIRDPKECLEDVSPGTVCKALIPVYFFNKATQKCEHFVHFGCGGTRNLFDTISECQKLCEKDKKGSDALP